LECRDHGIGCRLVSKNVNDIAASPIALDLIDLLEGVPVRRFRATVRTAREELAGLGGGPRNRRGRYQAGEEAGEESASVHS